MATYTLKTFGFKVQGDYTVEHTPKIIENDFGDGFSQRAAAGLRNDLITVSNVRVLANDETARQVRAFLSEHGGFKSFLWHCPQEERTVQVYCKSWRSQRKGAITTFSMSFTEVFN